MSILPSAVLFCCTLNQIRSPMAEGILKRFHGSRIFVDSVGIAEGGRDPFMIEVMREIGVDMSRHQPKTIGSIEPDAFELVIALSTPAKRRAEDLTRYNHCEVRFWDIPDPTRAEGNRAARLTAYRQVRDLLQEKILELFPNED